jgi:hypothetical protein
MSYKITLAQDADRKVCASGLVPTNNLAPLFPQNPTKTTIIHSTQHNQSNKFLALRHQTPNEPFTIK